ncbi:hypothetical protein FHG87_012103 [Trinorchestia longiramus]|nr:hypothetical protein FHG87_012103 [Trinorchestia longiramus]
MPSRQRYERVPAWEGTMADGTVRTLGEGEAVGEPCNDSEQTALLQSTVLPIQSADSACLSATGQASAVTVEELGPPKVDLSAPPPYSELEDGDTAYVIMEDSVCTVNLAGVAVVPESGSEPPSYEEVQRIKAVEAQLESGDHILLPPHTVTAADGEGSECGRGAGAHEDLLGTDMLFFLSFAAAFLFNWVGFVVLVCFCHSVAGRSGALAGFGLSLAKWALIMRHSAVLAKETNNWLLWLIMLLGVVISMRSVLQYVKAKREWQRASTASRHRFLLFH